MAFPPKKSRSLPGNKPTGETMSDPAQHEITTSKGGNPPQAGIPPKTTVPDESEPVDNPTEEAQDTVSPYPQIDDFLSTLDPDELAYLKDKCEALYPEDNTMSGGQSKSPMLDEKMFTQ